MDIVYCFLVAFVVLPVLVHLHFRFAPDVRSALVSPPVYGVTGCLVGISAGMIWFHQPDMRVYIEYGVIHALLGAVAGGVAGIGVKELYTRVVRVRAVVVVLTLVLLAGSVGAPIGWLFPPLFLVSGIPPRSDTEALDEFTQTGMLRGIAAGCLVGLQIGLIEVYFGYRRARREEGRGIRQRECCLLTRSCRARPREALTHPTAR